jgi:hypothetical protein
LRGRGGPGQPGAVPVTCRGGQVTDRSGRAGQMRAEVDDAWRRCLGDEQTALGNGRSRSNVTSRRGGSRAAATRRAVSVAAQSENGLK